jgi:hypothetical protein
MHTGLPRSGSTEIVLAEDGRAADLCPLSLVLSKLASCTREREAFTLNSPSLYRLDRLPPRLFLHLPLARMHEKTLQPPRRAPSLVGSEQTSVETLGEGVRGRTIAVAKPRPDGKVELTEQAAYEVLGYSFSTARKSVLVRLDLLHRVLTARLFRRWSILCCIFLVQVRLLPVHPAGAMRRR